jgi:hypothetical protein
MMDDQDRGGLVGGRQAPAGTPGGHPEASPETEYPMTIKTAGGSKTRLLLLLLVLVSVGAAYYFLMMGEAEVAPPAPPKATVKAPAPIAQDPTPAPATPDPAPASTDSPVPATAPPVVAAETGPAAAPASLPNTVSIPPPPRPEAPVAVAPTPPAESTPTQPPPMAVAPAPASPAVKPAPAAAVPAGGWLVEAGSYLDEATLKAVTKKLRSLGFEPQVSTTRTEVAMTRLRLWDVPAADVQEALAYARGIAPDAFALRSGELFTIYAGTFTNPRNLQQMTERLTSEGVRVEPEPVLVNRTLSRVRVSGLADQAAATEVAAKIRQAGIVAEVAAPR